MKTAAEFAKELNAPNREWLAQNPGGWCTMVPEEPEFWAQMGIHTGEELDRHFAISEHSDVYKETYGVRPRRSWDGVTTAAIREATKLILDRVRLDEELERREVAEHRAGYPNRLAD